MMNKSVWFAGVSTMLTLGFALAGCAMFNNFLNPPIHVIDGNGNKIPATQNSFAKKCKIGEFEYSYNEKPAVPAAPVKPINLAGLAPVPPAAPSGSGTFHYGGRVINAHWSTGEELRQLLKEDYVDSVDLQNVYDNYVREVEKYKADLSAYQTKTENYRRNMKEKTLNTKRICRHTGTRLKQKSRPYETKYAQPRRTIG